MKPIHPLRPLVLGLLALSAPSAVVAHPGHDHSNIPSLIRHPFADAQHTAITLTLLLVIAGTVAWWIKSRRAARHDSRSRSTRVR
jgi:hypothetical protein